MTEQQPATRRSRPTAADVAREAGLSQTTVSFVLNNTRGQKIPEATRQRVLAAAERLGYAPSAAARALARGRSGVVLCLLRELPMGPDLGRFLEQVSLRLEAHDLTFVWHPRAHTTRALADVWRNVTPAAVLTFEQLSDTDLEALRCAGAMVVMGGFQNSIGPGGGPGGAVGRLQVSYLAGRGHARLGYATPTDPRLVAVAERRLAGVQQECRARRLPAPVVAEVDLEDLATVEAAFVRWRAGSEGPVEAVCAYNDEVAMAVLAGQAGLARRAVTSGSTAGPALPVMGVDDIPAAGLAQPPLTTIRQDWTTIAAYTADLIVNQLNGTPPPTPPESYAHEVVVRSSA